MLGKTDLENILEFVYEIQSTRENFRENVLASMKNCFGFNTLTFFLGEGETCLLNPVATKNIEMSLDDYSNYYYQTDIFFFTHLTRRHQDKLIITESDIMTQKDFQASEYYRDFLKKYHLQQQVTMQLIADNRLMGAMGILKNEDEPPFTADEIQLLDKISKHVVSNLKNTLDYQRSLTHSDMLSKCLESHEQGVILFDSQFNILYENAVAKELFYKFRDSMTFSQKAGFKQDIPRFALGKSIQEGLYDFEYGGYAFHLIPHLMKDEFEAIKSIYSLYITPAAPRLSNSDLQSMRLLTQRERDIAQLIKRGFSNKQISEQYFISPYTVKTHLQNIYKKLDVGNRTALIDKLYG